MASIVCRNPDILAFDEPTLGQDGKEIKFLIDLIKKEKNNGKTIIIITHNIEFALEHIPRTILMTNGEIIADGPTIKILTNEFLVKESSLVLPQSMQFISALEQEGIHCPEEMYSKEKTIDFLKGFLKNKLQSD